MPPPQRITSRQNPRIKDAAKLRSRRDRQRQQRFLIDGAREIQRALSAGVRCVEAFVCYDLCTSAECLATLQAIKSTAANIFSVTPNVYSKLAFGDRDDGIVAVAQTPDRPLARLQVKPHALVAVLEGIEKPGNLGAILRSADAAGVDAVVVADASTDLYNPNTIRASIGTVFRDNVAEATTAEAIAWLEAHGLPIFAARPEAETVYTDADFCRGAAIVLGSEADGLSAAWSGGKVSPVRLPMHGLADSLNASTTAAVLLYEAWRQRSTR